MLGRDRWKSWSATVVTAGVLLVLLAGCSVGGSAHTTHDTKSTAKPSAAAAPDLTYLALGDSNVYGDPNDCGSCTTYPALVRKQLQTSSGKTIRLLDGSQHNQLTFTLLSDEIAGNSWSAATAGSVSDPPQTAIAEADIITITLNDNSIPFSTETDPCEGKYDDYCITTVEKPFIASVKAVLSQIAELRQGKPTAIRVTTEQNFLIAGPDYSPDRPAAALEQATKSARTFLDRWNADLCTAARHGGALCVDIYHAINGPSGRTPLPAGWYSAQYGDLNQGGHDFIAEQLLSAGWAPLQLG